MGLPIFELPESLEIKEGEEIRIDLDSGKITNLSTNKEYKFTAIPEFMQELIATGGLINYAKKEISEGKK